MEISCFDMRLPSSVSCSRLAVLPCQPLGRKTIGIFPHPVPVSPTLAQNLPYISQAHYLKCGPLVFLPMLNTYLLNTCIRTTLPRTQPPDHEPLPNATGIPSLSPHAHVNQQASPSPSHIVPAPWSPALPLSLPTPSQPRLSSPPTMISTPASLMYRAYPARRRAAVHNGLESDTYC